jgi:hypothetical protein
MHRPSGRCALQVLTEFIRIVEEAGNSFAALKAFAAVARKYRLFYEIELQSAIYLRKQLLIK